MEPISKEQETYIAGILKQLDAAQLEISRLRLQAEKADKVIGAIQQIAATYGEINRGTLASTIKHSGYEALLNSSKPTGGENDSL